VLATLVTLALAGSGESVEVVFTGDVIPHTTVKATAKAHARAFNHDGWDHVFGPLAETFHRADLSVVNLETPLTTARHPYSGELVFSAPPSLAQALAAVGVSVATFANNHALDQQPRGIAETRRHLNEAGLLPAGAADDEPSSWEPACVERNGLKLCFLAFTRFLNGQHNEEGRRQPHVPIVDYDLDRSTGGISERAWLKKVSAAAARCDALFIAAHWGEEYFLEPLAADRRLAWAMIDAGAVAVIGNHPHVLQSVETYARPDGREGLIAYSLGNLVSAQGDDDMDTKRDGLLLAVTVGDTGHGVTVKGARALPVWTENRVDHKGDHNIQPVVADDEIAAMRGRLRQLEGRDDNVSHSESVLLLKRLEKATARRERILSKVPADMYDVPPGPPQLAAVPR
jgi:poly-gamma-glutamate synthesis protein (capsule biosynthesis protein)